MAAGPLRDRIGFYTLTQTADGLGGFSRALSLQFTRWGSFKPERMDERPEAGRMESAVAGTMRVRVDSQTALIDNHYIARLDGVDYQVKAVSQPDRRERFYHISVERGVAT